MSVHKEGEGYSYWPGYVDALTNIVLNLLFLVAIFVIGVAALGLVAAQRKEVPQGALVSTSSQTVVERVKDVIRKIIVSSTATSSFGSAADADQKSKQGVTIEKIDQLAGVTVIRLAFQQDVYLVGKAEEVRVLEQLSGLLQLSGKRIVIRTFSQHDDALSVRGGMARLLSIRNILLRHGVAGQQIEVRIDSQAPASAAIAQVFIEVYKENSHEESK